VRPFPGLGATQYSWSLFNSGTSIASGNQSAFTFTRPLRNYSVLLGVTDSSGASTQTISNSWWRGWLAARWLRDAERGTGQFGLPIQSERLDMDLHQHHRFDGNTSGFTASNPTPEGARCLRARPRRQFQSDGIAGRGRYTLNFWRRSAELPEQRADLPGAGDGGVVGTFKRRHQLRRLHHEFLHVTAGAHAITFVGLNPNGGDNTAFVDQLQLNTAPTTSGTGVQQVGFETPSVGTGTSAYSTIRTKRGGPSPTALAWRQQ